MGTCQKSDVPGQYLKMSCGGAPDYNIAFSVFTDSLCTTYEYLGGPQFNQSLDMSVEFPLHQDSLSFPLKDMNINDQKQCQDMTAEFRTRFAGLTNPYDIQTDQSNYIKWADALARITAKNGSIPNLSWLPMPDVPGWCDPTKVSSLDKFDDISITRYGNSDCQKVAANGVLTASDSKTAIQCAVLTPGDDVPPACTGDDTIDSGSNCVWCTTQTEKMNLNKMKGQCQPSAYPNQWLKLTCDGSRVQFSTYSDDQCSDSAVYSIQTPITLPSGSTINVTLQDLGVNDNGVCSDLNAEFILQLQQKVMVGQDPQINADYEQAVEWVAQNLNPGWTIEVVNGGQICPPMDVTEANSQVNKSDVLNADTSILANILSKIQSPTASQKQIATLAKQAALATAASLNAAKVVSSGLTTGSWVMQPGYSTQKLAQTEADRRAHLAREALATLALKRAAKECVDVGCMQYDNHPSAAKGLELTIDRFQTTNTCNGTCTPMIPGEEASSQRLASIAARQGLDRLPCIEQGPMWISRTMMDTCIDSPYGLDYYVLTCAGEDVIFSDYTDANCQTPQVVPLSDLNPSGPQSTTQLGVSLTDLSVNEDGKCTDMGLEFSKKLTTKKNTMNSTTDGADIAAIQYNIDNMPPTSWKLRPSVQGWCKAADDQLTDQFVDVSIYRYYTNNRCLKVTSSGDARDCVTLTADNSYTAQTCDECTEDTWEDCSACAVCTVTVEQLDMANMHGKCTPSVDGSSYIKLNCDGSTVQFSVFLDAQCLTPVTENTGEVFINPDGTSGNPINLNFTKLNVYDNGVCTDINAEYLKQLRALLGTPGLSDSNIIAVNDAIVDTATSKTQSWQIVATANKQFCPAKTNAEAQQSFQDAQAALAAATKTQIDATGKSANALAKSKAAVYLAQQSVTASSQVYLGFSKATESGGSFYGSATQRSLQRTADQAASQAAAMEAEAVTALANQGIGSAGDVGLTLKLSRYTNSDCSGSCTMLAPKQQLNDLSPTPACTSQRMFVDRSTMGTCIKSDHMPNDYYQLVCEGEKILFSDYKDALCTQPESQIVASNPAVSVSYEHLTVYNNGTCTDMGKEFINKMRQDVITKGYTGNDKVLALAEADAASSSFSTSWKIEPSKPHWCEVSADSLDAIVGITITRYFASSTCATPTNSDGVATTCKTVLPDDEPPVKCVDCAMYSDSGDRDQCYATCADCTVAMEKFDASMKGQCVKTEYGPTMYMRMTCQGPTVMYSVYSDPDCTFLASEDTGLTFDNGTSISIPLENLVVNDQGACTDLNAEFIDKLFKMQDPGSPNLAISEAISTRSSQFLSWTIQTSEAFCPAVTDDQRLAAKTAALARVTASKAALAKCMDQGGGTDCSAQKAAVDKSNSAVACNQAAIDCATGGNCDQTQQAAADAHAASCNNVARKAGSNAASAAANNKVDAASTSSKGAASGPSGSSSGGHGVLVFFIVLIFILIGVSVFFKLRPDMIPSFVPEPIKKVFTGAPKEGDELIMANGMSIYDDADNKL